jgi:hypothetical protein
VAKTAPGAVAADPSVAAGTFDDPASLMTPGQDPFAVPEEAGGAETPTGEAVPKPLRNPKR